MLCHTACTVLRGFTSRATNVSAQFFHLQAPNLPNKEDNLILGKLHVIRTPDPVACEEEKVEGAVIQHSKGGNNRPV